MECDYCDHQWVAVSPVSCVSLECPQCHKMVDVRPVLDIYDRYKVVRCALSLIAMSYREHIDRLHTTPCQLANQVLDYLNEDLSDIPPDYEYVNELWKDFHKWRKENPPAA